MNCMDSAIFWTSTCIFATASATTKLYQKYPYNKKLDKKDLLPIAMSALAAVAAFNAVDCYNQLSSRNSILVVPISFFATVVVGSVMELALLGSGVVNAGFFFSPEEPVDFRPFIKKTPKMVAAACA